MDHHHYASTALSQDYMAGYPHDDCVASELAADLVDLQDAHAIWDCAYGYWQLTGAMPRYEGM